MFKCLIESDLECSLFSTYFFPQTLFARLLLVIYIKNKYIKESQHLFVYTIIISEKSPVLFGYFVTLLRECAHVRFRGKINAVETLASL